MRSSALWMILVMLIMAVGCALPKVALGASVSFGSGRGGGTTDGATGAARASVRNALWIALECSAPGATAAEREALAEVSPQGDRSEPCALEAACDWEHAAAQTAWLEHASASEQGEYTP